MFDSVGARFILRGAVAGALSALSAAAAIYVDNAAVQIAAGGFGAFTAYLGIGAALRPVEPSIGNRLELDIKHGG